MTSKSRISCIDALHTGCFNGVMRRRQILPVFAGLAAAPVAFKAAFAWPDQPIKLIVPFTPGTLDREPSSASSPSTT